MNRKHIIILLAVAAVLAGAWGISHLKSNDKPAESAPVQSTSPKPALTVTLTQAKRMPMQAMISANGSIAPWQEASIGAETNGLAIQEVLVNVGDMVKKGQVIARFNASTIEADLAQAQANVSEAKANLSEAENNANRARGIADTGAISQQQVTQYLIAEQTAKARLEASLASVNAQQIRLKQTTLLAPDSGIISKRDAAVGQVVAAGQTLFGFIRQGRLEWRGEFNSADIGKIKTGMAVTLTLPDNSEVSGKVRTLAPTADTATRNTLVYVDIPNTSAKAGMFAKGNIALDNAETLAVPYSAIVMRDGFSYLMLVDAQQHVHQTKVALGKRQESWVEVLDLANETASFVASGGAFLADGDTVRVVK